MPDLPSASDDERSTDEYFAKRLVCMWINARIAANPLYPSQFEVVTFSKILNNWKALLILPGRSSIYEITYDAEDRQHIISEYHRIRSDRLDAL